MGLIRAAIPIAPQHRFSNFAMLMRALNRTFGEFYKRVHFLEQNAAAPTTETECPPKPNIIRSRVNNKLKETKQRIFNYMVSQLGRFLNSTKLNNLFIFPMATMVTGIQYQLYTE